MLLVMVFGTRGSVASFFERISGVFQAFPDCSFRGLSSVLDSLAGSLRSMLDRLSRFCSSFLDCLASLSDRILVL
jgi:hypothetical protein